MRCGVPLAKQLQELYVQIYLNLVKNFTRPAQGHTTPGYGGYPDTDIPIRGYSGTSTRASYLVVVGSVLGDHMSALRFVWAYLLL